MPDFRAYVRQNLPALGIPNAREAEIVEELALEFQENYERALRTGCPPEQAWQEVRDQARCWTDLGKELRSALGEDLITVPESEGTRNLPARFREELGRDLNYAARQLWKSPGFTLVAVLMLALGIGANTAVFSLLNAVLLRNLPVSRPRQLVFFGDAKASGSTRFFPTGDAKVFSYPFFREFRRRNQVFSDVAAVQSYLAASHGRIAGDAALEPLNVELVSGTYFHTLGVGAALGRVFTDADDRTPGAHAVAVASYSWWQRRFTKDGSAIGKAVTIGGTAYTVIGVGLPDFSGVTVGQSPDLWIPLSMEKEISSDRNGLEDNLFQSLHMIGRLKPGISAAKAQANNDLLFRQILLSYAGTQPSAGRLSGIQHAHIELTPAATGRSELRGAFASPLKLLMAVVVLVLLIACANVANLLLVRAIARQREIAIRITLGAERWRLIRQLLAESAVLGAIASIVGVAFAWGASRLLLAMVSAGPDLVPLRVTPDAKVLGFTVAVTIFTVFLFGTVPALRATALDLTTSLKAGRGVIFSGMGNRLARGLAIGQIALSLVLLAGAGLFLRSLANIRVVDVGFDKNNVLRFRLDPGAAGYRKDERLSSMMKRLEQRVGAVPGVRGASFALTVFDGGGWSEDDITVSGQPGRIKDQVDLNVVGPQYLDVMKMPLVMGRALSLRDTEGSRKVAVINETMARTHFPGGLPLGRKFNVGDSADAQNIEVVGVVKNAKYMELEEKQMPAAFFPYTKYGGDFLSNLVVRYTGDPASMVPAIRKAIGEVDANLPVSDVATLAQMVDDFALNRRLVALLSTFFGILGALLACAGIYGTVSYGITRRTNEFGIRMALGAGRRDVLWVVLRETLAMAVAGIGIGVFLALSSGRLVESLLFGVESTNPLVLSLAVMAMVVVAMLAGYLSARRATRIDPLVALRYE